MDVSQLQSRIDAISWYHEFDFGDGLRARSSTSEVAAHRVLWRFIEQQLDAVDFRGKSVLDVGAWDGYWSFYAERRGARTVLAADDLSQNWSNGKGIHLAKQLLGSAVRINQDASIYRLGALNERFDVVLLLGVYYHLLDPFFGFAQLRHCCHADSIVLICGPAASALQANAGLFNFARHDCEFLPTLGALRQLLSATYFTDFRHVHRDAGPPARLGWRWRLDLARQALTGRRDGMVEVLDRISAEGRDVFVTCRPFEGENELHYYPPPFGLHAYDSRFRESRAA